MASVQLGVRANGSQVSLLLLIVVFIGAVLGLEHSVLPLLATLEFGILSATVTISFLVAFGFANGQSSIKENARRYLRRAEACFVPL